MQNTEIIENTDAFYDRAIWYPRRLIHAQVRAAASHGKRAQDKTTARKSEFIVRSDGLSLSQTEQPDNAFAVLHTQFTYNALRRVIRENRIDDTPSAMESVYDDSQSVTNPRNGLCATSKYRVTTIGSVAPPSTIWYDHEIRACTVGLTIPSQFTFNTPGHVDVANKTNDTRAKPIYNYLRTNNAFGVANQKLKSVYVTSNTAGGVNPLNHRYEFDSSGNITNRTSNTGPGDVSAKYITGTTVSTSSRLKADVLVGMADEYTGIKIIRKAGAHQPTKH